MTDDELLAEEEKLSRYFGLCLYVGDRVVLAPVSIHWLGLGPARIAPNDYPWF